MGLFAIGADAANFEYELNYSTGEYTVSGTIEEARNNKMLSIEVTDGLSNRYHISYIDTDMNGTFNYTFRMPDTADTGDYTIKLGALLLDEPIAQTVKYVDADAVNQLVLDIQNVSTGDDSEEAINTAIDSVFTLIDGKLEYFGLHTDYYSSFSTAQKKLIAKTILENRTDYDTISTNAALKYDVLLLNVVPANAIVTTLENKKDIYGIPGATCYAEYVALTDKTRFVEIFDTYTFDNTPDVVKAFNEAIVIAKLESSQPGDIKTIFTSFRTVFPFSLGTYDSMDADKVAFGLAGKAIGSMTNLDLMIKQIAQTPPPAGGSGGGGGGGGAASDRDNEHSGEPGAGGSYYGTTTPVVETPSIKVNFTDLNKANWAKDAIETLATKRIVSGVGENRFEPLRTISREEFVTILLNAFGLFDENYVEVPFTDVKNSWAYPYICKAYALGIVSGIDETRFGTGNHITREDMAVMLMRALNTANYKIEKVEEYTPFTDDSDIAPYAQNSVRTLVEAGVINGMGDNTFGSKASATRAESAMMIYQIIK